MRFSKKIILAIFLLVTAIILGTILIIVPNKEDEPEDKSANNAQEIFQPRIETVVSGLDHPWDIRQTENGLILFTQRGKGLFKFENNEAKSIYEPTDLYAVGEGGMLGLELSDDFEESRVLFTCFNSSNNDALQIVVAKLTLDLEYAQVINRKDIITGIPGNSSGRHSGCRILLSKEGYLWITTGDAANASNPQDPKSLGGKILRVDQDGNSVSGNLSDPFDSRIFSYGHRNTQGIALLDDYNDIFGYGFSSEHGPSLDDEINPLLPGNFGWAPNPPYDENVPMTDLNKFTNAIKSLWSSGGRTIAISELELVEGGQWSEWEGDLLAAALKDSLIFRFEISQNRELIKGETVVSGLGRIRSLYQGSDGNIYFTTDNGGGEDIIARIVPN